MLRPTSQAKNIFVVIKDSKLYYNSHVDTYVMFLLVKYGACNCKRHFGYYYNGGGLHCEPYLTKMREEIDWDTIGWKKKHEC